jgi:RNA polymerase sigma factor (sigma-70 family)
MDTDNQLLARYANHGSDRAFQDLVERHINLVHSAALRESGADASLAEDVSQAVFTELARRAKELVCHPAIAGWLYTCVRRMAANVRRANDRRQRREKEATTMNQLLGPDPASQLWHQVRPVLDDVMHELDPEDRTAVVLRFFEDRSLKEVGAALGLTENAARMRVERSLEKLHGLLSQRGVKSTASTLAAVLAAGAAMAAPAALASTVATGALATASANSAATFTLAKLLDIAKTKTAAAGALVVMVVALAFWHHFHATKAGARRTVQASARPAVPTAVVRDDSAQNGAVPVLAPTNTVVSSPMALQLAEAETGQPLPHAKLHLFYLMDDGRGKVVKATTDANGKLEVETPQAPFQGLNMFVTADGHVPKVTSWGFKRAMPAEYTMKLERGVTIGGIVVDEAGQPIAGAKVEFDGPGSDSSLPENVQFGPDTPAITDASGRWSCNMIPKEFDHIQLVVSHPEHAETSATVRPDAPEAIHSVITMKAGFAVAGAVEDSNGNPIEGAAVREVRLHSEGEHSRTTDASGAFEFKSMKAGDLMLAVQAKGFAPAVQTVQVTGGVSALRFQLGPGQLLRGRVTDEDGNPIPNAWVETTRRGFDKVKWSTNTDSGGRFEWDSAPQEPLLYSFLAEGFNRGYALKLQADGSQQEIKLARKQPDKDTIQISGTVVDVDTGLPLEAFNVMVGELDPDHAYHLEFGTAGKDGKFTLSFPAQSSHPGYQLQIEKEGYLPAVSPNLSKKAGSQTFDFKLQRGSGPSGVVLLPGGESAANAIVLLCTPRAGVVIDGPAHVEIGPNTTKYRGQTDEAGRFSLAPAIAAQGLIVVHDRGYAELSLADLEARGNIVTLEPWGRVEGTLILDSRPAANERVVAYNDVARYDDAGRRFTFMRFHFEAKTDSAGRFCFDKVPPGQCRIFRQQLLSGTGFESHETSVSVNAGQVTEVVLGGAGRSITGRAVLPGATNSIDWKAVAVQLRLKTAERPGSRPKRADFPSTDAYIAASDRFFEAAAAEKRFGAFCDSDGSFRLADVPAGTYQLAIELRDFKHDSASPHDLTDPAPEIGSLVREVMVPEIGDGQNNESLDLGILELAAHSPVNK